MGQRQVRDDHFLLGSLAREIAMVAMRVIATANVSVLVVREPLADLVKVRELCHRLNPVVLEVARRPVPFPVSCEVSAEPAHAVMLRRH